MSSSSSSILAKSASIASDAAACALKSPSTSASSATCASTPWSRIQLRWASVVTTNPGGTAWPRLRSRARPAALPPTRSTGSDAAAARSRTWAMRVSGRAGPVENGDRPGRTVDADEIAGRHAARGMARAEHGGDPVLAAEDGGVRHRPAHVGDDGADVREDGCPGRRGGRADEDLACAHLGNLGGGEDDADPALHPARGGRDAAQLVGSAVVLAQPALDRLGGDPELRPDESAEVVGHRPEGGLGDPRPQRRHDRLTPLDGRLPVRVARRARRGPSVHGVVEGLPDLPAIEVEEVVALSQDAGPDDAVCDRAHLVPEHRVVAVLDVEVVVLQVRADEARQSEAVVEGGALGIGRQQRAVLRGYAIAALQELLARARERLAAVDAGDVAGERGPRDREVVRPCPLVMEQAGPHRYAE